MDEKVILRNFSFLKENGHFKIAKEEFGCYSYYFEHAEDDLKIIGNIDIDISLMEMPNWYFQEENEDKYTKYKRIEGTPDWFQSLYKEVCKKQEKLTRVRKIFKTT